MDCGSAALDHTDVYLALRALQRFRDLALLTGCAGFTRTDEVVERFYEGEFVDTKPTLERRSVRLILLNLAAVVLDAAWQSSKDRNRKPGFSPMHGRDRSIDAICAADNSSPRSKSLVTGVSDFRSFRTMHPALMSSIGVRLKLPGQHGTR